MSAVPMSLKQAKALSSEEREQLIRAIEQDAHDNEIQYWGCSQHVLNQLQKYFQLGNSEVFKAASGFAGGIGRSREACGALIGGVMAIGLAYGREKLETGKTALEQPEFVEAMVRSNYLCEKFKAHFGCVRCSDVQAAVSGPDYKSYERYNTVEAFEAHDQCGKVTGPAARLAAQVILQPTEAFAEEMTAFLDDLKQVREEQKRG
jgi:C_GCAxxG_C_C family probable redox protein